MIEGSMKKFLFMLFHEPNKLFSIVWRQVGFFVPDKQYLQVQFSLLMGKKLHLNKPQTFNEKLQWLKLYDRNPDYVRMVDKYAVKDYVAGIIGKEYVIPTLGVWDKAEDIKWDTLPDRFVLKCTHDSGGLVICKDKSKLDKKAAIKKLKKGLKREYFKVWREWPYKDVPKRIIAEEYIDPTPNVKDLTDYKWYCFDGEPKFCQVIQDRSHIEHIDFFDTEWNHQEFIGLNPKATHATTLPSRPTDLEKQVSIARELSKGMPFSRIDLYQTTDKTYFGEITFYPMSGMGEFRPDQYNDILGQMIKLPGEHRGGVICKLRVESGELKVVVTYPDLADYKFFCFSGDVKAMFVATERQVKGEEVKFDFFDADFNHLPFRQGHENAKQLPLKPTHFELMKELAAKLSEGIPHVRIDFYENAGRVLFGEMTFFHFSGMVPFEPEEWDWIFSEWIELPKHNR